MDNIKQIWIFTKDFVSLTFELIWSVLTKGIRKTNAMLERDMDLGFEFFQKYDEIILMRKNFRKRIDKVTENLNAEYENCTTLEDRLRLMLKTLKAKNRIDEEALALRKEVASLEQIADKLHFKTMRKSVHEFLLPPREDYMKWIQGRTQ